MIGPKGDAKRNGTLLLEKIQQKLSGWKSNMLSHAGRLVLIKSVLMTIPVYYMTIEMLPKKIIKEINSLMAKFFWGKTNQNRYLALIAWKNVCKPVCMGGLGVKDLQSFGEALFLKLVWSLMADEDKPWVRICKAKYFPNVGYWRARNANGGSKMWRQILSKKDFFSGSVRWHIGNGEKTHALSQPWLQGWTVQDAATNQDRKLKVKDLVDGQTGQWNVEKLNLLFQPMQVQQILQENNKPVLDGEMEDKLIWNMSKNGKYTAKQGYRELLLGQGGPDNEQHALWEGIWKMKNVAPRIKIFLWRLINRGLPLGVHMHSRFPNFPSTCQRCFQENEYEMHCLFFCNTSRQVWFASPLGIRVHELPMQIKQALQEVLNRLDVEGNQLFMNTIWKIWKERNKAVIEHRTFRPVEVLQRVNAMQNPIAFTQIPDIGTPDMAMERYEWYNDGWQVLVDASWDVTGKAGCAYILYEQGFLHSIGMQSFTLNDPFMAEAKALQNAITQVFEQAGVPPMAKVQFFSDCLNLVQVIDQQNMDGMPSWRARQIVHNIMNQLRGRQQTVTLHHVRREAVEQAHRLANTVRRQANDYTGRPNWHLQQHEGINYEIDRAFFQRVQQAPP